MCRNRATSETTTLAKIKLRSFEPRVKRSLFSCLPRRARIPRCKPFDWVFDCDCGRAPRLAYDPLPAANMQSCTETPLDFDEPLGLFSTFKSMNIPLGSGMQVQWPSLTAHSYLCEEELFPRPCEAVSQFSKLHVLISSCYTCDP